MMFFKPWTYKCGDGRGALAFSLNFSKTIFHQRLSFSLAVRISATSSRISATSSGCLGEDGILPSRRHIEKREDPGTGLRISVGHILKEVW